MSYVKIWRRKKISKKQFDFKEFLAEQMLEAEARNSWGASLKWFSNMIYDGYCTKEQIEEWCDTIFYDYIFCKDPKDSYLLMPHRRQVALLYIWCPLLHKRGDYDQAKHRTEELWGLITKDRGVELSRRDRALMEHKLEVKDVRGALKEIIDILHTPDLTMRLIMQSNIKPNEDEFTHISKKDNTICYFEDGAPVVVKHFEHKGRLFTHEHWLEREPYYSALPDEDGKPQEDDAVSPIYQIIKAQRMLTQVLKHYEFESKPVRKIIVAPDYKAIFDNPEVFASECKNLDIELHQDLTALNGDINAPYDDMLYWFQWTLAVEATEDIYNKYRTIDSNLIHAIIDDMYGKFPPNDSYEEENPFTIEDMR